MSKLGPPKYKGRRFGIAVLVAIQSLIGLIHAAFGSWLLFPSDTIVPSGFLSGYIYPAYTLLYGLLTLAFAAGLWLQRSWGWYGTVAISFFVVAADSLTILNLQSVPGIPKIAGAGEIPYSLIVIAYLLQSHVRKEYRISRRDGTKVQRRNRII